MPTRTRRTLPCPTSCPALPRRPIGSTDVRSERDAEQPADLLRLGYRAEAGTAAWRAALRQLAEAASERRAGVPRLDGGVVHNRCRPERAELCRARHRAPPCPGDRSARPT